MKKIMMGLAILGITCCGINAQARTCHSSPKTVKAHKLARLDHRSNTLKLANNYRVCREEGGYYVCCMHENTTTARLH